MPENSPWLHPSFLVTVALALIGLVAWFIRLESKTNANATAIERLEKESDLALKEAIAKVKEIEDELYKHIMDTSKHYNEQFMTEFKTALDRRFLNIEGTLKDINGKLDRLAK